MLTDDARCTLKITSTIAKPKAAINEKMILFSSKADLNLKKKLAKCYIWSKLRKVDQKYLDSLKYGAGE